MRPLSPQAAELIERLGPLLRPAPTLADRLVRGWHRLRPGADAARWSSATGESTLAITLEGLLEALVRGREPRAVVELLAPARRAGPDERRPVREALRRLLHGLATTDLLRLDAAMRSGAAACALTEVVPSGDRARLHALAAEPGGQVFLELCTLHPDGRLREAALAGLGTGAAAGALGLVLLRVNDWVAPVRQAALASLESYLAAERLAELVAALPLLLRLGEARRADHQALVERARALLAPSAPATTALLAGLGLSDGAVVRCCARLLFGAPGHLDRERTLQLLRDARNHLRLGAAGQLVRLAHEAVAAADLGALEPLLDLAGRDGLAQVRCAGLRARVLAPAGEAGVDPVLVALLDEAMVDPALPVRQLARAERARLGVVPAPREVYLERLDRLRREPLTSSPGRRALIGALLGLGETGKPVDRMLAAVWLTGPAVGDAAGSAPGGAPPARVVRAALRALGLLDRRGLRPELLAALRDPRRSVAREAARGLTGGLGPSERVALLSLIADPLAPDHGVALALELLATVDEWAALPALVLAAVDVRGGVAARASVLLRRCRLTTAPTVAQQAAAQAAVALVRGEPGAGLPVVALAAVELSLSAWRDRVV